MCVYVGFPGSAVVKNLPGNSEDIRDMGSIPGSRRCPGVGNGNPLWESHLENPMNSMKRQKDITLENESLRSEGVQYATGEKWRNKLQKE